MALGVLELIFYGLGILALLMQVLLYKGGMSETVEKVVYGGNVVLALAVVGILYTSLPSNFSGPQLVAVLWGVLAVVSLMFLYTRNSNKQVGKYIVSLSLLGALVQLFLF